jgi:phosphate transport system protein
MQRDLERLKKSALEIGTLVEESISQAISALSTTNRQLAERVIAGDQEIDRREVQIEEDCLKIFALHQPVARDLRFVVAVLKMNNDLERMGDYAANMAERVLYLATHGQVPVPRQMLVMSDKVQAMVRRSLDAVVESDTALARAVCTSDDEVDYLQSELYDVILSEIRQDVHQTDKWIQLLSVVRYLERIADLATNISQDVIYMVEGDVVRHKTFDPNTDSPTSG